MRKNNQNANYLYKPFDNTHTHKQKSIYVEYFEILTLVSYLTLNEMKLAFISSYICSKYVNQSNFLVLIFLFFGCKQSNENIFIY